MNGENADVLRWIRENTNDDNRADILDVLHGIKAKQQAELALKKKQQQQQQQQDDEGDAISMIMGDEPADTVLADNPTHEALQCGGTLLGPHMGKILAKGPSLSHRTLKHRGPYSVHSSSSTHPTLYPHHHFGGQHSHSIQAAVVMSPSAYLNQSQEEEEEKEVVKESVLNLSQPLSMRK